MPKSGPLPSWHDADVYVIGGGHSLDGFDFSQLRGRRTIGCNQAFRLGHELCNILIFGDGRFWHRYCSDIKTGFGGWVVTNYYEGDPLAPWVNYIPRQDEGLSKDKLGWNFNTGASATHLALMLGAKRVLLLGMDMCVGAKPEDSHWHKEAYEVPTPEHYSRFINGFAALADALPAVYPGTQIINVTDGTSKLPHFPRLPFEAVGLTREVPQCAYSD